jgi:hypothetical protein
MGFRLLNRTRCAEEWGWSHGDTFATDEEEDFLQELILYITQGRHRGRQWTAGLVYRPSYEMISGTDLTLLYEENAFEKSWTLEHRGRYAHDPPLISCQRLQRVVIAYANDSRWGTFRLVVSHAIARNTLEGFYYVKAGIFFTRCASVHECVDLFNRISYKIFDILSAGEIYYANMNLFFYLSRTAIALEQDSIRIQSMQRNMQMLKSDSEAIQIIEL